MTELNTREQGATTCLIDVGCYRVRLEGAYYWKNHEIPEDEPAVIYARKIVSGEFLSCENERLACARFLYDLDLMASDDYPWVYDWTRADRVFRFMSKCVNVDGEDGEFIKLRDFQQFDLGNIFGWVSKKSGVRRFTEALIYESRGQGKSTECAGVSLYGLTSDCWYLPYDTNNRHYENEPEIVTLAVDKEQCKAVRGCAMNMATKSPDIAGQIEVGKTFIRGMKRGGTITSVSKETGNLDGGKPSLIICDEWAAHKEDQRLSTLRGGLGKKKQGLVIKITTAGLDCAVKPAYADYQRCCGVLRGLIKSDRYFIMIREMEKDDRVDDWDAYEKCAPMLRGKDDYAERLLDTIKTEYSIAFEGGTETQRVEYLTKRTNRWQISAEDKYFENGDYEHLQKCMHEVIEFENRVRGRACIVGIDLSKNTDISGVSFIFNLGNGVIGIHTHGFMPKESFDKHVKTDKLPYAEYVRNGWITLIEGTYIDTKVIEDYICDYEARLGLNIRLIASDPAFAANFLNNMSEARNKNKKSYTCVEVRQTTTVLNEPTDMFKVKVGSEELFVEENELFAQHCVNAYVQYDNGGQKKVSKKNPKSPYRIDLLAATIFGLKNISVLSSEGLVEALKSGRFTF